MYAGNAGRFFLLTGPTYRTARTATASVGISGIAPASAPGTPPVTRGPIQRTLEQ